MKVVNTSGRRKRSIARATLIEGKGIVRINSKLLDFYQPAMSRLTIMEPLMLAGDISKKINIKVDVHGGGFQSQTDAIRLAIARALVQYSKDKSLRQTFLDYDRNLLIADIRYAESSKPNDSKPRAARQKSYR
ncbi:30S ribosomal protein S9 [Candidatus Woesearchaeota archaeon]|nr:30S ribosomal protein S9 [Candidatus Woesearchaeota archaeon]